MQYSEGKSDEFLRLLGIHQTQIYAYVLRLVGNYNDADDVMQETTSLLWKKFDEFEAGTNFVAWGIKVAHYKILNFRNKQQKLNVQLIFDNDVLDMMAAKTEQSNALLKHFDLLERCLKKLSERDFNLIKLRYYTSIKPKEISNKLNIPIMTVYKKLARAHKRLLKCVKYRTQEVIS